MESFTADEPWELIDRLVVALAARSPECRESLDRVLTPRRVHRLASSLVEAPHAGPEPEPLEPRELARALLASERPGEALRRAEVSDPEALARELVERSRRLVGSDPRGAERAASLALQALDQASDGATAEARDLRLAALLHRANALRCFELWRAGVVVDAVEPGLDGVGSVRLRGDLHLLAALVRRDQGRWEATSRHLCSALEAYAAVDDPGRLGRLLLHVASFLRRSGNLSGAISAASSALELAEGSGDGETLLAARHNLAVYLVDAGEEERAGELLVRTVELHRGRPRGGGLVEHRWLSARLAAATGDLRGAADAYEALEGDLLEARRFREAALVVVELGLFRLDLQDREGARRTVLRLLELVGELPAGLGAGVRDVVADLEAGGSSLRLVLHRLTALLRDG